MTLEMSAASMEEEGQRMPSMTKKKKKAEVRAGRAFRLRAEGSSRGKRPPKDSCNSTASQRGVYQNLLDGPLEVCF
jgi:hypothetical protein